MGTGLACGVGSAYWGCGETKAGAGAWDATAADLVDAAPDCGPLEGRLSVKLFVRIVGRVCDWALDGACVLSATDGCFTEPLILPSRSEFCVVSG